MKSIAIWNKKKTLQISKSESQFDLRFRFVLYKIISSETEILKLEQ